MVRKKEKKGSSSDQELTQSYGKAEHMGVANFVSGCCHCLRRRAGRSHSFYLCFQMIQLFFQP